MEYVDKLLRETEYLNYIEKLERLEAERIFCRHGLGHLLDTARIAWIWVLEEQAFRCGFKKEQAARYVAGGETEGPGEHKAFSCGEVALPEKETVYLAALLHDLGRIQEYEEGIPHQQAGAKLARQLLCRIGYPKEKLELVVEAIEGHRDGGMRLWAAGADRESRAAGADEESRAVDEPGKNAARRAESLRQLLFWADKKSRNCFYCGARPECKWEPEKRNEGIRY